MTEPEWLACEDAEIIAGIVWRMMGDRKQRLIACGCCRLVWNCLVDERSRKAVEVSERFADGLATEDELSDAAYRAEAAVFAIDDKRERYGQEWRAVRGGWLAAEDAAENGLRVGRYGPLISFDAARLGANCAEDTAGNPFHSSSAFRRFPNPVFSLAVVRDIFGNPFRPVTFSPEWRTDTVVKLARGMYESRDFGAMPILADALQDAGCDNLDILSHCRGEGQHVRGCWVCDLVLGKE